MTLVFLIALGLIVLASAYYYVLAFASLRNPRPVGGGSARRRFAILIAAHDEQEVIGATVESLRRLDYPRDLADVHVVADYCTDETARRAREAGAVVHERNEGGRTGKGAAINWLLHRTLGPAVDAVVVFDADTLVEPRFLRVMNAHLDQGERIVQGQHVIRNHRDGWFPALVWAMFLVDNRFNNLGRTNLGLSAKNMGDSICFDAAVLRDVGWSDGLTDDYRLRHRLLLRGLRIAYAPEALGYGEAPPTVHIARTQRLRWLRGVRDSAREGGGRLLAEAAKRRQPALLDAWLQAHLPSYSTLAFAAVVGTVSRWIWNIAHSGSVFVPPVEWLALVATLCAYPLIGLAGERAPASAYRALLSGPFYIVWRVWLAATTRISRQPVTWVRTAHGE